MAVVAYHAIDMSYRQMGGTLVIQGTTTLRLEQCWFAVAAGVGAR